MINIIKEMLLFFVLIFFYNVKLLLVSGVISAVFF